MVVALGIDFISGNELLVLKKNATSATIVLLIFCKFHCINCVVVLGKNLYNEKSILDIISSMR